MKVVNPRNRPFFLFTILASLLFGLLASNLVTAQAQTTTIQVIKNIAFQNDEPAERADVYLPVRSATNASVPAVIWMHGNHHDKADVREQNICTQLAEAGYVAISINYGSWPDSDAGEEHSPRILQNIANARNAVRFFRAQAGDYGIDPKRIALSGGSAGGWLALMAGLTDGDPAFDSAPPYPGVSSAVSAIGDFYADTDAWLKSKIATNSPPVLIVHGKADTNVDYHESVELDQLLANAGVPHKLVLLENVGHGFDFISWQQKPLPQDLRPLVLDFLKVHLASSEATTAISQNSQTASSTLDVDVDKFGIQKIYADASQPANNWTFNGNTNDPRFMEQKVVKVADGWFKPQEETEMRVEVLSDPSATEKKIETFDVGKVLAKGYLFKPPNSPDGKGDFLNIEQTWRFKVVKTGAGTRGGPAHIELVPGGYQQNSSKSMAGKDKAVPVSCESMSYHFNIYPLTGRVKFEKDSDHITGYTKSDPQNEHAVPRFDNGQIVIQKAVLYRTAKGMKLESYLDMSGRGNNFQKVLEFEDIGQWGPTEGGNAECHCPENVVLSMARMAIGFRCDNMVDFEFRDMSIRSINPSRPIHHP